MKKGHSNKLLLFFICSVVTYHIFFGVSSISIKRSFVCTWWTFWNLMISPNSIYLSIYTWIQIMMLFTANSFSWFALILHFRSFKNLKKCLYGDWFKWKQLISMKKVMINVHRNLLLSCFTSHAKKLFFLCLFTNASHSLGPQDDKKSKLDTEWLVSSKSNLCDKSFKNELEKVCTKF